jgi:hypothetical protein
MTFLGLSPPAAFGLAMLFAALVLGDQVLARRNPRIRPWAQLVPASAWLLWSRFGPVPGNAAADLAGVIVLPVLLVLSLAFAGVWLVGLIGSLVRHRVVPPADQNPPHITEK